MSKISKELKTFLAEAGVSAAHLAQQSGVHEVDICRLRLGRVRDTSSTKADALRAAMRKIDAEVAEKVFQDDNNSE